MLKFILPLIAVLLLSGTSGTKEGTLPVYTEKNCRYISLYDLRKFFPMETSFDLVLQKGRLYSREHVAVYTVGHSVFLCDGSLKRESYPVIRLKGDILLPVYFVREIINDFYPDIKTEELAGKLAVSVRKPEPSSSGKTAAVNKDLHSEPISFIIIDAGHGGKDPGALGKKGLREKDITLQVSRKLESTLKKKSAIKGIPVYMTRRKDVFLELYERTEKANRHLKKNSNGIFISIHVNASVSAKISGFETYFLSQNASNEDARNTAALENNVVVFENKSGTKKYGEIEYIEARMITTQIQKESSMLANAVQNAMDKKITKFKSRGVRKADFFVLRGSLMPAALVEIGFITNEKEAKALTQAEYQQKIAESIANGISSFILQYQKMLK